MLQKLSFLFLVVSVIGNAGECRTKGPFVSFDVLYNHHSSPTDFRALVHANIFIGGKFLWLGIDFDCLNF
jgi:hypothetical protein